MSCIKSGALGLLVGALGLSFGMISRAEATPVHPGPAIIHPAPNKIEKSYWTATSGFVDSWFSDDSGKTIGDKKPPNVEAALESSAWLNMDLTFVGGGNCGSYGLTCRGHKGTYYGPAANVFGVRFGDEFIVLLYTGGISEFEISDLPKGVNRIYAFNSLAPSPVPLPAALPLMATGLAGLYLAARRRRRRRPALA